MAGRLTVSDAKQVINTIVSTLEVYILIAYISLAWPDRFFPFFFVMAEQRKTEKSGLATRD